MSEPTPLPQDSPLGALLALAAVGVVSYLALTGGLRSNKGHRVQQNRMATVVLHGSRDWGNPQLQRRTEAMLVKRFAAKPGDSGAGIGGWDAEYEVPMNRAPHAMEALRHTFRKEMGLGELQARLDRNLRGVGGETGNRGARKGRRRR